jgi:drug/metabolite transporter (DMT)-like permease
MQPGSKARLELLAAAALFSTGGAAIKWCAFSGWQVAGLRSLFAVLAFLVFVRSARAWPTRFEWLVGTAYAATLTLFVLANKQTTAANTIFLQSTAPLYILLASPILLHERIRRQDVVFLFVMVGGLALLFVDEARGTRSAPRPMLGNVLALASGVAWATTVMGLRWLGRQPASGRARGGLGAVVAGNALTFLVCSTQMAPFARGTSGDWAILVYLGVVQIALAYLFLTSALALLPAFEASVILLVEPVLSPLWAWIIHGEKPGAWALAGGAILVLATTTQTIVDARRERRSQAE